MLEDVPGPGLLVIPAGMQKVVDEEPCQRLCLRQGGLGAPRRLVDRAHCQRAAVQCGVVATSFFEPGYCASPLSLLRQMAISVA